MAAGRGSPDLPTAETTRRRGRPIDPEFETRVHAAAIAVFAESGWSGFTLNAVIERSRVGKASLYRRWASKEDLMVDALLSLGSSRPPETGSFREDLVVGTENELLAYLSPTGTVRLRAQIEAKLCPELFGAAMERFDQERRERGQRLFRAAIVRGELPENTDTTQLMDALNGMTVNHFLSTPTNKLSALRRQSRRFAESSVDFVLRAAWAGH